MLVLVTGATGFVGGHVVRRLIADGHGVRGLVRPGSDAAGVASLGATPAAGDVGDTDSLPAAADGVDAFVHLVGIIREVPKRRVTFGRIHVEGTRNVVAAAKEAGVRKIVYVSAVGARPNPDATKYHRTKFAAEELVRGSGITHVILRPTMQIGPRGEFTRMLLDLISRPIVPVIGSGRYRVQPMCVGDLAMYISKALASDVLDDQTFEVAGPDVMTFDEMLRRTAAVIGKKPRLAHAPLGLMKLIVPAMERLLPNPPITTAELQMLLENGAATETRIRDLAPIELHSMEHALRESVDA